MRMQNTGSIVVQRFFNVGLAVILGSWATLSYAESSGQAAFGDQLTFLSWATMKYVLFLSFWGCLVRLLLDLRSGRFRPTAGERFIDTLVIFIAGFTAGFFGFVACEWINAKFYSVVNGRVIPDLVMCAVIASAAVNRESMLRGMARLLLAGLDKVSKGQQP